MTMPITHLSCNDNFISEYISFNLFEETYTSSKIS